MKLLLLLKVENDLSSINPDLQVLIIIVLIIMDNQKPLKFNNNNINIEEMWVDEKCSLSHQ